jgi:hypothetical protein
MILENGDTIGSPGGSFTYVIKAPLCRLYDREELPWPSCSLRWKGKQPSWNRVGRRFVPDLGASRFGSYAVSGRDYWGSEWEGIQTIYANHLTKEEKRWWYSPRNERQEYPEL